ncbi:hypothetical protein LZ554_009552 [Drepanopeziza brunnea f. sp. 'monogermtubi']|nr:hypothetical protein LZ554_009552 [Drepanopeziza brunnea f. sp. 'monogermtubi']
MLLSEFFLAPTNAVTGLARRILLLLVSKVSVRYGNSRRQYQEYSWTDRSWKRSSTNAIPGIQLNGPQLEEEQHESNTRNAAGRTAIGQEQHERNTRNTAERTAVGRGAARTQYQEYSWTDRNWKRSSTNAIPGIQLDGPQLEEEQHERNTRNTAGRTAVGRGAARTQYQEYSWTDRSWKRSSTNAIPGMQLDGPQLDKSSMRTMLGIQPDGPQIEDWSDF